MYFSQLEFIIFICYNLLYIEYFEFLAKKVIDLLYRYVTIGRCKN